MIKWIKALLVGIVIWYLLTIVYGFIVGILDLNDTNFFKTNSNLNNWILYPIGVWLGFKVTKTSFWGPIMDSKK